MSASPAAGRPAGCRVPFLPLLFAAALLAGACSSHYAEGLALERQGRWEEAAIAYHLAVVDDPEDPEYREALQRANKVVARENFDHYKRFLAAKQFRKAYLRLVDAARQDPEFQPVQEERRKWMRVLVAGQVAFEFQSLHANLSLADQIRLIVRINSPNPGETLDAEINLDTGTFYAEDLLYDRPPELFATYSIHAVGVSLYNARRRGQRFSSREFLRLVNFREPVLEDLQGQMPLRDGRPLAEVAAHRPGIVDAGPPAGAWVPQPNPHYRLSVRDHELVVSTPGGRSDFTPRFLYLNGKDRRLFVDFGRYAVRQIPDTRQWGIARLPLPGGRYFASIQRNAALQPYFYFREGVYTYRTGNPG